MSDRYKGAILSPTAPTVTPQSAGGIYTSSQQLQYQGQGVWPQAVNNPLTNSLRFRGSASAQLTRTFPSAGNKKTWTWSAWVKRGSFPASVIHKIFTAESPPTYDPDGAISFGGSAYPDNLRFQSYVGGVNAAFVTTQVFRDPAAWYHIIIAVDTTQATSTDRVKIYVNGLQVTAFTVATYPSQNVDLAFNGAYDHILGSAGYNFDGYLAEVNFINALQLTPSSFGTTDAYGIWQPIPYTGTYGTNGFYLPFRPGTTSSYAGVLSSGNYLSAASNAAFSMGTGAFTMETWFLPTNSSQSGQFFNVASGGIQMGYQNSSTWGLAQANVAWQLTTNTLPITNVWNHMAIVRSGTGTNQTALFLNGVRVAQGTISTNYSQNSIDIGNGIIGYMSNSRVVKGTAVYDPAQSTYTVPTSPLTNISGTSLLTFQNTSAIDNSSNAFSLTTTGTITYPLVYPFDLNIASDESGNGNNWTTNNISLTPGSTYDSMTDVPTNTNQNTANYATINAVDYNSTYLTLDNGNLHQTYAGVVAAAASRATMTLPTTGKWYWEVYINATGGGSGERIRVGVTSPTTAISGNSIDGSATSYLQMSNGQKRNNSTDTTYGSGFSAGQYIQVLYDATAGAIYFGQNGSYANGTGSFNQTFSTATAAFTGLSGELAPCFITYGGADIAVNFGQQPFAYTPPTGFYPLNTYNLPTPTILAGNQYMNATLWTGNGSTTQSVSGVGFQPDFVWVKGRSVAAWNRLQNTVAGINKLLYSNDTAAEATDEVNGYVSAVTSDGFTLADPGPNGSGVNGLNETYVGWSWRASNAAGVSNTQGTITSTVSANTTAGFSIATFTTPTSGNFTVGHGLGVAPSMYIIKRRGNTSGWGVWHKNLAGGTSYLLLNTSDAQATDATVFSASPTSTILNIGSAWTAGGAITAVAYCFAEVAGYSAMGSYTGNGSTDGPFIYTGFKPAFILTKDITTGSFWWEMIDSARTPYNVVDKTLYANVSDAEYTGSSYNKDLLSNGFKIRNTNGGDNTSGSTYVYVAFAENPFKIARAR